MLKKLKIKFNYIFPFLSVITSLVAVIGLLNSGFPLTDDGNWMVIRFSAFYEALSNGQFPVRYLPRLNDGYGYPVANFLYPLFMYVGVPIKAAGFSFIDTVKILFGLSFIGSSLFSFLWLREKFESVPSLVGSLVYTFFPYHLWDIYGRGSIGEALAFALVPFVLWSVDKRNLFFSSVGLGLLILSHNTLALFFIPIIFFYSLISPEKINFKTIPKTIIPFVFGLGLSAFFWIPALYDRQFTIFGQIHVSDFSRYFVNLENFSLYGPIFLLTIFISVYLFFKKPSRHLLFFFVILTISFLLTLPFSSIIWENIFLPEFVQFPFRFISIVILSSSFIIAYYLDKLRDKNFRYLISLFFALVLLASSFFYILPSSYQHHPDTFYSTNRDTTTVKKEYMPKWVKNLPERRGTVEFVKGEGDIENIMDFGSRVGFDMRSKSKSEIKINYVYFPGWEVEVDGKPTTISYSENGLMRISIDEGNHRIVARFTETPLRVLSNLISIASLIVLIVLMIFRKKLL
jgi:hypothetical protein